MEADDPTLEVVVTGGEITWRGECVDYEAKLVAEGEDGAVEGRRPR
ncbi:hypothetical protein [Phenylobacterium sp.]|nr:hypothetical protein [Phenylobacterium sp.]